MRKLFKVVVAASLEQGQADKLHELWIDVILDGYIAIDQLEKRIEQLEAKQK